MTVPPSFPPPARPDLADRLLAAVAERDLPMADRLVQQWVHRRGLAALEALIAGRLLASQGAEAARWLQARAGEEPLEAELLGGEPIRHAVTELEPTTMQLEPESVSGVVKQGLEPVVKQRVEPAVQAISHPAWQETACEELQEARVSAAGPAAVPAAIPSPSWPQLAVVPDGEPAPAPRALAPLRAWLPDANLLPLAS